MPREVFLEAVKNWNVCPSDDVAEMIVEAYTNGQMSSNNGRVSFRDDLTEEQLRIKFCKNFYGPYAWVDYKGRVIPCSLAGHEILANLFFGPVSEVEKKMARINCGMQKFDDAFKYVDNSYKTEAMINAAAEWVVEHRNYFAFVGNY